MGKIDRFLRAKVFPHWRIPPSRGFYRLAWSDLIALSSVQLAQQVFAVHPNASQFSRSKAALWSEWLSTVHLKRFCSGWELNPKHSCCAVITVTTKRQFPCLTNNIKIPVNVKLWCQGKKKRKKKCKHCQFETMTWIRKWTWPTWPIDCSLTIDMSRGQNGTL